MYPPLRAFAHGFVETPSGLFAFDSEGVGPTKPVTDDSPYPLEIYNGCPATEAPLLIVRFRPDVLRSGASGNRINLADFILQGKRLDQHYDFWRHTLAGA
jgi:hypothetical protein